jgi:PTH1 family peptidyl-tRNA hydrolase
MKIIACLGNPGDRYRNTRHNVGFLVGKYLADQYSVPITKKGFSALYGVGRSGVNDLLLIFPQTFMNMSGVSINAALSFYKEDAASLIVIHDEIELPFGDIRKKSGGGHKGHNGLRSLIQHVGTGDFVRIRFGVGRPEGNIDVADYVLSDFTGEEKSKLDGLFLRVREELDGLIS